MGVGPLGAITASHINENKSGHPRPSGAASPPMYDEHINGPVPPNAGETSATPSNVSPVPIVTPDEQDKRLGASGQSSIYQSVRLLSPQHRLVVEHMLSGKTPSESCRLAGFSSTGPLDTIARRMPDIMDRCGLTDIVLIEQYLKPLLSANLVKAFKTTQDITLLSYGEDGKAIERTDRKELIIEERSYADNGTRLGALNLAARMRGMINIHNGDQLEDDDHTPQQVNVQIVHIGAGPGGRLPPDMP